jgi:hypothetical protein
VEPWKEEALERRIFSPSVISSSFRLITSCANSIGGNFTLFKKNKYDNESEFKLMII